MSDDIPTGIIAENYNAQCHYTKGHIKKTVIMMSAVIPTTLISKILP